MSDVWRLLILKRQYIRRTPLNNCNRKFKMADFEERINRISGHQGVGTLLIVNEQGRIITQRHKATSSPAPQHIANHITDLAIKARSVVRDIDPNNVMTFFRVRARRKEILVAPDKLLFLIVIQETDADAQ